MTFVIVVVFINIQLIIDESLPQGFPNQIHEAFTKVGRTPGGNRLVNFYYIKGHRVFESRK